MIPKSDLFGAVPAAAGNTALTLSPEHSAASQSGGDDFLTMISQMLSKNPDMVPLQPDAPSYSAQENSVAAYGSDGEAGKSPSTTAGFLRAGSQPSSPAPANNGDSNDPSVLSTIMALFAQPTAAPADLQKVVPAQGKDLKITGEHGGREAPIFNEPASLTSTQKTPASPTQSPPAAPGNELANLASKPALRAIMQSLTDAGTLTSNVPPSGKEPVLTNTVQSPSSMPQLTAAQDVPLTVQECLESTVHTAGMGTALNNQRMKFAAEKNEIAGRAVQKLPDASSADDFSSELIDKANVKSDPDLPGHAKDSFDPNLTIDLTANASMTDAMQGKLVEKPQSADTAATQVERVTHLVTQEVISIRQSGATSLAVSLKLDSHTELFLQLTNHDGQIQASVRCERGNMDGLGSHWGDLQESLGRQNVQLLPLEDKGSSRNSSLNLPSDTASSRAFNQSSHNQQRQARDSREQGSLASTVGVATPPPKTKINNRSRQGWESWA